MADKFISVLDKVGDGLKWFFTNKTAEEIEQTALQVGEIAFPAVAPLLSGIQKSFSTAQGLASTVPSGLNTSQTIAIVLADAQASFAQYEVATGTTIEPAIASNIIALFQQLLQNIPGATNTSVKAS